MSFQRPGITTDGFIIQENKVLLVKRKHDPFKGQWALPGGFVEYGEKTEECVLREILEETGLVTEIVQLLGVYSDPTRDPRGHTITIVYSLKIIDGTLHAGDDAEDIQFFHLKKLPNLAFDHEIIIKDAIERL